MTVDRALEIGKSDERRTEVEREEQVVLSVEAAPLDRSDGVLNVGGDDVGAGGQLLALEQEVATLLLSNRHTAARGRVDGQGDERFEDLFKGHRAGELQNEERVLREVNRGALGLAEAAGQRVDKGGHIVRSGCLRGNEEGGGVFDDGRHLLGKAQAPQERVDFGLRQTGFLGEGQRFGEAVLVERGTGHRADRLPCGGELGQLFLVRTGSGDEETVGARRLDAGALGGFVAEGR